VEFSRTEALSAEHEQRLIDRCQSNDLEAFGRIVDAYQNRIYGFVRRMTRDDEDALDLTQEVFVRAYRNVHAFDGRSSLKTWLFKIANNLCIDRARRKIRRPEASSLEAVAEGEETVEIPDVTWNPEEMMLNEEFRNMVEQAIATMSEKLRNVLLLHDKEDLSYEEVATTLEIPVGTVKSRLFLARAHLSKAVGGYLSPGGQA
jgi:RNA polymerase sigma-70 factor (ECF subfamily)